jgi:hypothetical protein
VDTLHWRSPWIFPYAVNEISEFSLIYSSENEKSFTITRSAPDSFSIADYQGDKTLQPKQTYIQQYLSFCNTISLEAYQNELPCTQRLYFVANTIRNRPTQNNGWQNTNSYFIPKANKQCKSNTL